MAEQQKPRGRNRGARGVVLFFFFFFSFFFFFIGDKLFEPCTRGTLSLAFIDPRAYSQTRLDDFFESRHTVFDAWENSSDTLHRIVGILLQINWPPLITMTRNLC